MKEGEILLRVLYVSVDPVMRVWLSGAKTYFPGLKPGDVMHCFALGEVIFSRNPEYSLGDYVFGNTGI